MARPLARAILVPLALAVGFGSHPASLADDAPPAVDSVAVTSADSQTSETDPVWPAEVPLRDWNFIVIHHTATPGGSVAVIDAAHRRRTDAAGNHWRGIGYHFLIGNGLGMADGEIAPTFRWTGQQDGAHAGVTTYNKTGIGIALVGNFEQNPPTPAQLAAVKTLVAELSRQHEIDRTHVVGHGSVKATACPGRLLPLAEIAATAPPAEQDTPPTGRDGLPAPSPSPKAAAVPASATRPETARSNP